MTKLEYYVKLHHARKIRANSIVERKLDEKTDKLLVCMFALILILSVMLFLR